MKEKNVSKAQDEIVVEVQTPSEVELAKQALAKAESELAQAKLDNEGIKAELDAVKQAKANLEQALADKEKKANERPYHGVKKEKLTAMLEQYRDIFNEAVTAKAKEDARDAMIEIERELKLR